MSLGVNVGFTHTKRAPATKEMLMLVVTAQTAIYTTAAPELTGEPGEHDGQEGALDEDVVLDSGACNYEDHLVTRSKLAALHHELAVDPLPDGEALAFI